MRRLAGHRDDAPFGHLSLRYFLSSFAKVLAVAEP